MEKFITFGPLDRPIEVNEKLVYKDRVEKMSKDIDKLIARVNEIEKDLLNVQYRLGDHIRGEDDG